jgi:hypothetical protein
MNDNNISEQIKEEEEEKEERQYSGMSLLNTG